MKKLLLLAWLAIGATVASAQTWISGAMTLTQSSAKYHDDLGRESGQDGISMALAPTVGYDLNERWGVGVSVTFGYTTADIKTYTTETATVRSNRIAVSPFVRYYFAEAEGFRFYADGGMGIGRQHSLGSNSDELKAFLLPGVSYDLNNRVSIVGDLGGLTWNKIWNADRLDHTGWHLTLFDQVTLGILFRL